MKSDKKVLPAALTVAGSDSGGGAGIQADMLTFAAYRVHACSAISAITAQNPEEVAAVRPSSAKMLEAQLKCVFEYYAPKAAKTGMLATAQCVRAAARFFGENRQIRLVVDPVMISTSGAKLLSDDAAKCLSQLLIPLAEVFTPNLDEASVLLGGIKIDSRNIAACAVRLAQKYGTAVLLKGGHLSSNELVDILAKPCGSTVCFRSKRIGGVNTHGSGCTLSAAIAANMALGKSLPQCCAAAKKFMHRALKKPVALSRDLFINRFPQP